MIVLLWLITSSFFLISLLALNLKQTKVVVGDMAKVGNIGGSSFVDDDFLEHFVVGYCMFRWN